MAGAVSRVGYHDNAGGSLYCDPVSALGSTEGMEASQTGDFNNLRSRGRVFWERGWRCGSRSHYAVRCVENSDDACRGEAEDVFLVGKHTKRIRIKGFLRWDRPTGVLDQCGRGYILGELPMGK